MNTVSQTIRQRAREQGERTFLVAPEFDHELSYAELDAHVQEIGEWLDQLSLASGARAAFLLDNGSWTALLFLGVMANRRVIVPLNAVAGITQLSHVLEHSGAEVLFISREYRDKFTPLLDQAQRPLTIIEVDPETGPAWPDNGEIPSAPVGEPEEDDTALLLYTSGSTGLPKGAILSHRAIIAGGGNVAGGHQLERDDRALCVLPLYHINGAMVTVAAPLVSGGSVVMPQRFSAQNYWAWIAEYRCTWSSIVPTIIKYLLDRADQEPYDFGRDERLARFRFARSASSALPAVTLQQWESTFHVPMIETLGLTETAGTVATNPMPPAMRKPGSVGLAYGNQIRVVNENGVEKDPGEIGELVIRGDNVLDRYHNNHFATAAAFLDGWFRTGDLGLRDQHGYLYITGRLKELIIRGGENIAPREIDDVLYRHEAVLEAAAFGVDDEDYGQEVVACVVCRDSYDCTETELLEFCRNAVGAYKAPKRIYFMTDLPKGPSGKIQRLKLRDIISPN